MEIALVANLKSQIASQLINEGIFMQEIQRTGYTIDEKSVEKMLQESLQAKGQGMDPPMLREYAMNYSR